MYKQILLPIDLGNADTQSKALQAAVEHCQAFGAKLHILSIVPDFGVGFVSSFFPDDYAEKAIDEATKHLSDYVKANVPKDVSVSSAVAQGSIYEGILACAREQKSDLIVMASHRPELSDYLIGPNASRVVRHANCSVMVVRG